MVLQEGRLMATNRTYLDPILKFCFFFFSLFHDNILLLSNEQNESLLNLK